jgi:hypothetical protein
MSDQAKAATKEKNMQNDLMGAAPKAPTEEDANAKAEATLTQNRRALLASGGQTDITGGAPLMSGNVKTNQLLGS